MKSKLFFLGSSLKYFFLLLSLFQCTERRVSKEELKQYVANRENGLYQTFHSGGFEVELIYRPNDLVVEQMIREGDSRDSLAASLEGNSYFVLRISKNGQPVETDFIGQPMEYNQILNYLSEGIREDVIIRYGGEKLIPSQIVFTPSYGTSTMSSVLIVFDKKMNENGDFEITVEDRMLGVGTVSFEFDSSDFSKIPTIQY